MNAWLGYSVALGDVNGDGYADIFMGAPNMSSTGLGLSYNGYAYLYLTDSGTLLPSAADSVWGLILACILARAWRSRAAPAWWTAITM